MRKTDLKTATVSIAILAGMIFNAGCGDVVASGGLPSDKQVIKDVTPLDTENVVDVSVNGSSSGEPYLHDKDLVWYYDRGVVVKRKAELADAPDAVLIVGGLARYVQVGDKYEFHKFLTTYNEYEGIPAPKAKELKNIVIERLPEVFVSRDHRVVGVHSIKMTDDKDWIWHNTLSFTVPYEIEYDYVANDITVETRRDMFDIRFYRQSIDKPIHAIMASERDRKQLATKQHTAKQIQQMKTLRDGLVVGS